VACCIVVSCVAFVCDPSGNYMVVPCFVAPHLCAGCSSTAQPL
jgi:hypothetical protein